MAKRRKRKKSARQKFAASVKRHKTWPLVLSEGDSWFHYPIRKNTIDHIAKRTRFSLLRLENSGDEVVSIMSGKQKHKIRNLLKTYDFELILFSGGGNDIVGEDLHPLLRNRHEVDSWEDCIHKTRFRRRLTQIKHAYMDLIDMRNDYRPDCVIMTHGYDYPIPSDVGAHVGPIKITGPWMKPSMEERGVVLKSEQKKLAKELIRQFDNVVIDLAAKTENFIYIKTPGTLRRKDWGDEIHPTSHGFKRVADKFLVQIQQLFPDSVRS